MESDLVFMDDPLTLAARRHVAALSLQYQNPHLLLYNDQLGGYLEERVHEFGQKEGTAEDELQIARLAALFYPLGRQIDAANPQRTISGMIKSFLAAQQSSHLESVLEQILIEAYQKNGTHSATKLLLDALIGILCHDEPHNWAEVRQLEQDLQQAPVDRLAQTQLRLQELLNIRFQTTAGRAYWQEKLARAVLAQKKKLEKQSRGAVAASRHAPFAQLEPQLPVRGAQTYFRAIYRNHINLSAIADNKANIMISVNSILISVLITFLSYRNIAETNPAIILPVVIFLVTGISSLIFAVLSARPKVTNVNRNTGSQPTRGLAFFGNFVQLSSEEFTAAMDEMFRSTTDLYDNMVQDLYHLGKVLDKKYRYLSIAYNIFMVGLIITVALFLITLFAF